MHRAPLFPLAVAWLLALCLAPLWLLDFVPLQDHPYHLFIAAVAQGFDDPGLGWAEHYERVRRVGPYSFSYLLLQALAAWTSLETAGRLLVSLYFVGVAAVALGESRLRDAPPWGALLVFPLALGPIYFLGFHSYLLSLPLLFLALRDLERLGREPLGVRSLAIQAAFAAPLFLTHPYSVLVYAVLGAAATLLAPAPSRPRRAVPLAATTAALLLWLAASGGSGGLAPSFARTSWWTPAGTGAFALLTFTGLRLHGGIHGPTALLWAALFAVFAACGWTSRPRWRTLREPLLLFSLVLLGVALLPFAIGPYSYFNLRLLAVAGFLLALLAARLPLPSGAAALAVGLVSALLLLSFDRHAKLSAEIREIEPVLAAMEPGARILPLLEVTRSRVLDPLYFYQLHSHVPLYYHVRGGGGANPIPLHSALLPIRSRDDRRLPAPLHPRLFDGPVHAPVYRYFVTRGLSPALAARLGPYGVQRVRSGPWALYESRVGR